MKAKGEKKRNNIVNNYSEQTKYHVKNLDSGKKRFNLFISMFHYYITFPTLTS